MNIQNALTVSQLAELNPAFSEATIRWWIFKANEYDFNKCLIRIQNGRKRGRVFIDLAAFAEWLEERRAETANDDFEGVV